MSISNYWSLIENSWITRRQFQLALVITALFLDDQISIYLLLVIGGKPLDGHHIVLATHFHDWKLLDEQINYYWSLTEYSWIISSLSILTILKLRYF